MAEAYAAYCALFDAFILPEPADLFALGYSVDGVPGRSVRQVREGLSQVVPNTRLLLEDELDEVVGDFIEADTPTRAPLARRFARWLREVTKRHQARRAICRK